MKSCDVLVKALIVCLLLAIGCSDDGKKKSEDDAGPDGGGGPDSITMTIVTTEDGDLVPLEGATVAFDAPGGDRLEAVSDADGVVTFDGFDWSLGEATLTAHMPDYIMISVAQFTQDDLVDWENEDGEYQLELYNLNSPQPETVQVSGTAAGLEDTGHLYVVNAVDNLNCASEWSGGGTDTYSIAVPLDEQFILQSLEVEYTALPSGQGYDQPIYQVMHMDYGPVTEDAVDVELDFATYAMTTHEADVTMLMPPRPDSPLRTGSTPYCYFCAAESNFCHGWPTYLDVVDDQNRIDISYLWVEPEYVETPYWFCWVSPPTGEAGQVVVPGAPEQDDEQQLIDSPSWITPEDPTAGHPLHEPLEWEWYEDVEASNVAIVVGMTAVWYIMGGENATTLTIPEVPSSVDEEQFLGTAPYATVYGGTLDEDIGWLRYSQGRGARLDP